MAEQLTGEELDARFFEVCWGVVAETREAIFYSLQPHWIMPNGSVIGECSDVSPSTDATDCEAWAMRWARERHFHWSVGVLDSGGEYWAELLRLDAEGEVAKEFRCYGTDYKQAFVRACVVAGETLNKSKGET